jgi:hypothetical protein
MLTLPLLLRALCNRNIPMSSCSWGGNVTGMRVLESADATQWLRGGVEQQEFANANTVTAQGKAAYVECEARGRQPASAAPLPLDWSGA